MTPFLLILGQFFQGTLYLSYYWLAVLYSRTGILWTFSESHYLCPGNLRKKTKFSFIQEPWTCFLVKSRNTQILFYFANIMTFSKFAQEIYFYLLVASLYLSQSKSKIFIHSFIHSFHAGSHAPINDFKWSSSKENITKSLIFESSYFVWWYFFHVEILLNTFKKS